MIVGMLIPTIANQQESTVSENSESGPFEVKIYRLVIIYSQTEKVGVRCRQNKLGDTVTALLKDCLVNWLKKGIHHIILEALS